MPLRVLIALLFACSFVGRGDDAGLIRIGDNWRFFKGTNEPSVPPEAWRSLEFNDAPWPSAQSGFSSTTPIPEATTFTDFPGAFQTLYLRKKFTVADLDGIKWLTLRTDYDDGFVAYLNGVEIVRRGLAGASGDFVPFNATATKRLRGSLEEIDLTDRKNLLLQGTNILAVQVHNSGPNDYTFAFVAELLGNFIRGPFLQSATTNSIIVVWRTPTAANTMIEYGTDPADPRVVSIDESTTNHVVTLTNLLPNTTYQYQISSAASGVTATAPIHTFTTLKMSGPITFTVMGDSGYGGTPQYLIAGVLRQTNTDFVLHVGDLVYPSMSPFLLDFRVFSVYNQQMANTSFFYAMGNHDSYFSPTIMLENLYLPTNNVTGTENFYSFDDGEAHFAVLFSDLQAGATYYPGSVQYAWLDQDLASTKKPWKFLFFHHVIRSSAVHAADDFDLNGVADMLQLEQSFGKLATQHGVQLIFTGHDHDYERLAPVGGTASFVTGGGGTFLYGISQLHPASVQFVSRYHYLNLQVSSDETFVQAIDYRGKLMDQVHIRRDFTPAQTYQANWNTPFIESRPADDGDGNILNQTFNLTGIPIPGKPGQLSSPGRLWVNNDRENLYLGLDEVEATAGKNVFLFIENPNSPGVKSMAPIGNGKIDPDGEGADGLDFLANLAFTNFAPSIGCILGDEMADETYRSFLRPGVPFNIGQGAFQLAPGLPEVEGFHVQQFNHSPQTSPALLEEDADYIEMAIPFSQLGNLKPGDTIRVGIVVGLSGVNTNADAQTRELDSGGIGYSIQERGGITYLEPVTIQLAPDPDSDGDELTDAQELVLGTDPHNPDTDGDGLPDGWEVFYKLNPLSATGNDGASGDPDKDGLTNLQEFLAGTNPLNSDTDGDGMPDNWEIEYGLNPLVAVGLDGPSADLDGDGLSNLNEYLFGTSPLDPSPLVVGFSVEDPTHFQFSWPTMTGKHYQLQSSDHLGQPFQNITADFFPAMGTGSSLTFILEIPPQNAPARFYRIAVAP